MGDLADSYRDRNERAQQDALQAELARYARLREAKEQQVAPRVFSVDELPTRREYLQGHERPGEGQVVQVRLPGAGKTYAYAWRGAQPLEPGDWVELPPNGVSPKGSKGRVDGFGRDGYRGPLKDVVAKVEPPDPWTERMKAATTPAEARSVWAAAKRAELDPQRLQTLKRLGREALAQRDNVSATLEPATEAAR